MVLIIGGFAVFGIFNGLILSIISLASFWVSAICSVNFYPHISEILIKTPIYKSISATADKTILAALNNSGLQSMEGNIKNEIMNVLTKDIKLPEFLKSTILNSIPNVEQFVNLDSIASSISVSVSRVLVDILSMILLFTIIMACFAVLKIIFKRIVKLPVLSQIDKIGGFCFGAIEGTVTVFMVFAVLMLFNTVALFGKVFAQIESSQIANYFYQNNFIIDWMKLGGKI